MTDDRSLERAARSWLELGPTEAPDHAVETALLRIQATAQERDWFVPRRVRSMTSATRLLAAAIAIAVVAVGGALILRPRTIPSVGATASPSSAPPASATIRPSSSATGTLTRENLEKDFTSDRYGYTVSYLPDWTIAPASKSWIAGRVNNWNSGYNDELFGADIRFSGAAQVLAPGQTDEAWLAAYAAGSDPTAWPTIQIDGLAGRLDADGVQATGPTITPGGVMFDAVVIRNHIAFNFNMDGAVDRATFDAVISTIRLPTVPPLDTTFTSSIEGYSVKVPSSWAVQPATKVWKSGFDTSDPALADTIGSDPKFTGLSTRMPAGSSFGIWYAAYDAERRSGTCASPAREETISIAGVDARLDVHCPGFYTEAVLSAGGRAYVFTLYGQNRRAFFDAIALTIRVTPETAKN